MRREIDTLVQFEGRRCADGYKVRNGKIYPVSKRFERYLSDPEAFLRFAQIPVWQKRIEGTRDEPIAMHLRHNTEGKLAFANEHGLLGDSADGESLDYWLDEMNEMREALNTLATANWNGSISGLVESEDWLVRHNGREPLTPAEARQRLRTALNRHLTGATLQAEIDDERFRSHVRADSLLTSMWAQLLESVSTDHTVRRCEGCSKWMEIRPWGGADTKRLNRRTCSNACRVRVSERIKRLARQLYGEGMPVKEIVEKLRGEGWRPAPSTSPAVLIEAWVRPVSKTGKAGKRTRR